MSNICIKLWLYWKKKNFCSIFQSTSTTFLHFLQLWAGVSAILFSQASPIHFFSASCPSIPFNFTVYRLLIGFCNYLSHTHTFRLLLTGSISRQCWGRRPSWPWTPLWVGGWVKLRSSCYQPPAIWVWIKRAEVMPDAVKWQINVGADRLEICCTKSRCSWNSVWWANRIDWSGATPGFA